MGKILPIILAIIVTAAASSTITYLVTIDKIETVDGTKIEIKAEPEAEENEEETEEAEEVEAYEISGADTVVTGAGKDETFAIKSAHITKTIDDEDAVIITYEFTRLKSDAESFAYTTKDAVYQNGAALDNLDASDFTDETVEKYLDKYDNYYSDIKPGYSIEITRAYLLRNTTDDVVVEVEEDDIFSVDLSISRTFSF